MFSPGREKGASHWSRRVLAACGEELSPVGGLGRPGKKERDCIVKEESEVWCVTVCVCVELGGEVVEIALYLEFCIVYMY